MNVDELALQARGVVKCYGDVRAVDGVDVCLGSHEVLALVGPSGCGKSTFLRLLAGLEQADGGHIEVAGRVVDDGKGHVPPERRGIGLVFQDHSLFPHLTVEQNIGFGVRGVGRRERGRRVGDVLGLVELAGYGGRYPHELSGGQRQRVAVARALAPGPGLLLLDEPFASLDHNLRVQVRDEVRTLLHRTETPAVFVTHDQNEALAVGDRIGVMRAGRLIQVDRPEVVYHRPLDRFTGALLGEASFLPVAPRVGEGPATPLGPLAAVDVTEPDRSEVEPGRHVAMVRPDDVGFTPDDTGDATVVGTSYRGAHWVYAVALPDGSQVLAEGSHLDSHPVGTRGRVAMTPGHRQVVVTDG